jgi:hypothetical protein
MTTMFTAPCTIHSLATEILSLIFDWYQSDLPAGTPPVVLSHVCDRWRRIVVALTASWATLAITHTRRPDILKEFLSRSNRRPLSLSIFLPFSGIELWPQPQRKDFIETFRTLHSFLPRTHTLLIYAPNPTLRIILNNAFKSAKFSSLASLTLVQHSQKFDGNDPLCFFGPLQFDPAVFTHLSLNRVMIDTPAPCLAGLRSLSLTRTSGSLLDHEQLIHPLYPSFIPAPAMPHLRELSIEATNLIVTNAHANSLQSITPSFSTTELDTLRFSRMKIPNDIAIPPTQRIFSMTWGPHIRHLILDHMTDEAMICFVEMLAPPPGHHPIHPLPVPPPNPNPNQFPVPRLHYGSVTKLTVINVKARFFCNQAFAMAFPEISDLCLFGVDNLRAWDFLHNSRPWPRLSNVTVDGIPYRWAGTVHPLQAPTMPMPSSFDVDIQGSNGNSTPLVV